MDLSHRPPCEVQGRDTMANYDRLAEGLRLPLLRLSGNHSLVHDHMY